MNAYLYKLRFDTAAHFGASDSALSFYISEDHFCADTLFSALCHTASATEHPDAAADLCQEAKAGNFLLSDSMPWSQDKSGVTTFFLPRPMLISETRQNIADISSQNRPENRKEIKKLNWLPVNLLDDYATSVYHNANIFDISGIPKKFGEADVIERAAIPREIDKDANPYPTGAFYFYANCGLYFIALIKNPALAKKIASLLNALGVTGIGGKISSGYGKFSLIETIDLQNPPDSQTAWIYNALIRQDSDRQILLTASLPRPDEIETALDDAYFQLIRRAGFVRPFFPENQGRKKRVQYYLTAGSVLRRRFSGNLYPVGDGENDYIFRYGRPVFLGLA